MGLIKNIYHRLLLAPAVPFLFQYGRRNCASVFMLHRFKDKDRGVDGLESAVLRESLEYLRRNNYKFMSLTELFERLAGNGSELRDAVVFTMDDGYIDQAEIAGPIFAEYDCPVTTFLTTGFMDGTEWGWWDKIEYIISNTAQLSLVVKFGEEAIHYKLSSREDKNAALSDFVERCKSLSDDEMRMAIAALAANAEVDLPTCPPPKYESMTWNMARSCELKGMTFGPHTVTHPVLSKTTPEQAMWEINESWVRLNSEVEYPVPIFCYPNGQWSDFGQREIDILRGVGLHGAVVGAFGFADTVSLGQESAGPFRMKRLPFPDKLSDLIQYVSGVERFKQSIRNLR